MADSEKDITIEDLPEPISREDALLHNIIDGTPDISDLEPLSREEVYLKYIALNGGGSGGGGGDVNIVQTTGQSQTSVMSQKAVTDNLNNKVNIIAGKGLSTEDFTTAEKEKLASIPNDIGNLGTAAYCDIGVSNGNVPILDANGKLSNSVIPSLALTDTYTANSEEEMLDLTGVEQGDICVRTDENKTYILDKPQVSRYRTRSLTNTSIDDWVELLTPTDEVTSVNGKKGNVTITAEDIDTYTKTEIDGKLPNIVQTNGTSTTKVMSQKAVSDNTCFGVNSIAGYSGDISIGANSYTSLGIAIGKQSKNSDGIAIGSQSQNNGIKSIALGNSSEVGTTETPANSSIAIGGGSTCYSENSISIGTFSNSNADNSVSLGFRSEATEESTVSVGDGSGNAYGKRRIVNVKDPVNAQDAATKNYVDAKVAEAGGGSSVTIVQTRGTSKTDVMSQYAVTSMNVIGLNATSNDIQDEILLIGDNASTNALFTTTIGYRASSPFSKGTAFGYNSISGVQGTSIGCNSKINEDAINSVSLGNDSLADEQATVSVGNSELKRRIVNVADPVNNQDAVTKKYVDDTLAGKKVEFSINVPNNWVDIYPDLEIPYYTQSINVNGVKPTDEVFVYFQSSSNIETYQDEIHAYSYLSRVQVLTNMIKLHCYSGKPNAVFRIQLICIR